MMMPTGFHNLTAVEVSSLGFRSFIEYLCYLMGLNRDFVRFYIDRCFYHDPDEMVSFIKADENLFQSSSRLPEKFFAGAAVQCVYILLLLAAACLRFDVMIYRTGVEKDVKQAGDVLNVKLKKGDFRVFFMRHDTVCSQLYKLLSGKMTPDRHSCLSYHLEIDSLFDGQKYTGEKAGFVSVCHPCDIPENARVKDWLSFMARYYGFPASVKASLIHESKEKAREGKYFRQLEKLEKGEVFLGAVSHIPGQTFLLNDIADRMPIEFYSLLNTIFKRKAADGAMVIALVSNPMISDIRFESDQDLGEIPKWSELVETIEKIPLRKI